HIKKQVHFANNSHEIKSESFGMLDEIADLLIVHPEIKRVEIQGHTDNRGTRDYNLDLSDRRAASIRQYLINSGVESSRLDAKGYGPDKPIAPNITGQGRARNRRVELHILEQE
ncbi:MAG: OmpA family protein, partial [Myxococcota bacterium]|nr:OmpA family protein [Myxococcota bacterium]